MTVAKALVLPAGIEIAYERFGDPKAPPVLLIMGIAAQMINWPDGFCAELVARGLQAIRFDNRDSGLSTHLSDAPVRGKMPTLVIHGSADRMIDISGGRATASAIPGAELVVIEGMGHDLPRALWPALAGHIAALANRADATRA